MAKVEFVKACQGSEALRSMRRIEADIDGAETEKRLFARFLAVTVDGPATYLCPFASFWNRMAPSASRDDEAIGHAVVALGAAYQLFQRPDEPVIDGLPRDDLDVFTIQHYNKSIDRLKYHVGSPTAESIRVTLLCCFAFISLETLRGNHAVAVTHLENGLRILQSLPDSAFGCLADGALFVWPPPPGARLDMPAIIQLFARLELSTCLFTHGLPPVVSARSYRARRFDDGSRERPFEFADLFRAHRALCSFTHDVMARLHEAAVDSECRGEDGEEDEEDGKDEEWSPAGGTAPAWSEQAQQQQQQERRDWCLAARGARLGALADDLLSRLGSANSPPGPLAGLYLDLVYFRSAQVLLILLLLRRRATAGPYVPPPPPPPPPPRSPYYYHPSSAAVTSFTHYPSSYYPALGPAAAANVTTAAPDDKIYTHLHLALRQILHLASTLLLTHHNPAHNPTTTTTTSAVAHHHLLGPLYLVLKHATTPDFDDDDTASAAMKLLAEGLLRSPEVRNNMTAVGGAGTTAAAERQQQQAIVARVRQAVRAEQQQDMMELKKSMGSGITNEEGDGWVSPCEQQARQKVAGVPAAGGGGGEGEVMPRAVVGVGCVPSLWDAVMGDLTVGGLS